MKVTLTSIVFVSLIYSSVTSCAKDKVQQFIPITTDTISFSQTVLPLMLTNCATSGCHDSGSAAGGRILDNYESISQNANDASSAMRGEGGLQQMPLGADQLPDSTVSQFRAWISQGKQNN